jgi:hypothetical protein
MQRKIFTCPPHACAFANGCDFDTRYNHSGTTFGETSYFFGAYVAPPPVVNSGSVQLYSIMLYSVILASLVVYAAPSTCVNSNVVVNTALFCAHVFVQRE